MSKRTLLIAGNWKMHKTISAATELVKGLHYGLQYAGVDVVVAPPFTALNKVAEALKDSFIGVAAQDLFWEEFGAYTGEVSAPLLKDAGATYVIIGHSERRQYFGETDATVNKKTKAALSHQLIPIVCVGETLEEREAGKVEAVIEQQVRVGLQDLNNAEMQQVIVAYEPVWAIGTGRVATPEQAEAVHVMIRKQLSLQSSQEVADVMRIIYGGSVKASNSKELFLKENIDGALVGGASLKVDDFVGIIKAAV